MVHHVLQLKISVLVLIYRSILMVLNVCRCQQERFTFDNDFILNQLERFVVTSLLISVIGIAIEAETTGQIIFK